MYNLDRTQFVKVAKDLTENELLPIYFHQKAVCNLFGLEFHTHQSKNPREKFLQTIFNSYDRVKQQLDDLEIDNKSLVIMQNCTSILEQIIDTQLKLKRFAKKNKKDPDKDPKHRAEVVYSSSFLLMSFIELYTINALYILENYLEAKIVQLHKLCSVGLGTMNEERTDFDEISETCDAILNLYEEVLSQFLPTEFENKFPLSLYTYEKNREN